MRNAARIVALATTVICSTGLSGCRELEYHFGQLNLLHVEPQRAAKPARKPQSVVDRVASPRMVPAGDKIRGFCGQRHIRFQTGGLRESDSEKARNDVLCQQAY